ncbi:DUF305 domain-containing protein [Prauserella alba]|nr:DUF305 domain-containing protein [Prauserella alba]MCP2180386.1 Uncharacterized conserved protein, DUF305 family [Prauserella alba]
MKSTNAAATAAALTAALVLTGCAGQDTSGGTPTSTPAVSTTSEPATSESGTPKPATSEPGMRASAEHNDADIAFAQGMIPHHRQAIEMSELADDRAGSPELRRLAARIERAQAPEIATLRGFLSSWDAPESATDHGAGEHSGMSGMMTDEQLRRLERSDGTTFDRLFLDMMIDHHEGALRMARDQLANGTSPEATELAREIIDTQRAEITEMRGLLE